MKTLFGNIITVLGPPDKDGWIQARCNDGSKREYHVNELVAENDKDQESIERLAAAVTP